jgi:hypothetical protein
MEFTIENFHRSWYKFARKFLWTFHNKPLMVKGTFKAAAFH